MPDPGQNDPGGGRKLERILVNCALPYANGPIHLGHLAGCYIGADIFVRFNRLIGNEVMFISGSDEYGTPITIKADREKVPPSAIADRYHTRNEKTFRNLDINFDIFSRTSDPRHSEVVGNIFLDLLKKGYLEERTMTSPFCPTCNRFLADRYVEGTCPYCGNQNARGDQCDNCGKILDPKDLKSPRCIISGDQPEFRETKHFFFLLNKIQDRLLEWFDGKSNWRQNVQSFTRNFISNGLKARPVTRDLEWGVPVPLDGYDGKRIYVWFEALMGYVSASIILSRNRNDPDYWKRFWQDPQVKSYYFLAKDNITFHSVIWPSIIIAHEGLNLPYDIPANEYLNFSGKKFSKSQEVGFVADEVLKRFHKDYIRYYLASILPESGDSEFSFTEMQEKVNTELISKYGNLVHRISTFASSRSMVISCPDKLDEASLDAVKLCEQALEEWSAFLSQVEIKKGLKKAIDVIQAANSFFNESKPWNLVKTDMNQAVGKLWVLGYMAACSTVMIYPYIPSSAKRVWEILGFPGTVENGLKILRERNFTFTPVKSDPPFRIIEDQVSRNGPCLRVGIIREAVDHPDADKLFVLKVDLGDKEIQLVAGLRKNYAADQIMGRRIVVVSNLKHSKIRGQVSEGMLLAADDGEAVRFLTVDDSIPAGSQVLIGGESFSDSGEISIDDLQKFGIKVSVRSGAVTVTADIDGREAVLTAGDKPVFPERPVMDGARVR